MTAFGAPQQLYHRHIICTQIPFVLQPTLRLSLTTRSKAQASPGHPQGRCCLDSAQGSASWFEPCKRSPGSRQEMSRDQDSVWASCLPLLSPHEQNLAVKNRHKVLLDENLVFQTQFNANPSCSLSAEGARQFRIGAGASAGDLYLVFAAVSQKGACSPMVTALHGGLSRSCFFLSCMYKSLSPLFVSCH